MPPIAAAAAIIGGGATIASSVIASKNQEEAQTAAQEEARRQELIAHEQQAKVEEASKLTPQELEREQRLLGIPLGGKPIELAAQGLESQRQDELNRRAKLSGEALISESGPITDALLKQIMAEQGLSGQELYRREGAIPETLINQVLAEGQNPEQYYQNTLDNQMKLMMDQVNAEANRRGLYGGSINLEQMGRAGVELAINSARERMNQRQQAISNMAELATQFMNLKNQAFGRQAAVGEAALGESAGSRSELQKFLNDLQALTAASRERQASGVAQGVNVAEGGYTRSSNLTNALLTNDIEQAQVDKAKALAAIGKTAGTFLEPSITEAGNKLSTWLMPDTRTLTQNQINPDYDINALEELSGKSLLKRRERELVIN